MRRADLERMGRDALRRLSLPVAHLGYAMVALDNAFWREQFAATRYDQRVLLLPHCLRNKAACKGKYDADGLVCAGCGSCSLCGMSRQAKALGYTVMIAEGTPSVVQTLLGGRWEAVLGVACLDSLEKAFHRVSDLGIPHAAVPLLRDGCCATDVDVDEVMGWMRLSSGPASHSTRAYYPLLRQASRLCDDGTLARLLAPCVASQSSDAKQSADSLSRVESVALDWLRRGGKRFRPFLALAAYAAADGGGGAPDHPLPDAVLRVALALEAMHKASLAHDDIEDGDLYRYGAETLHRRHGVPMAINTGDYLVGLGYALLAAEAPRVGPACVSDILSRLSRAHLDLSRGQGMELLWREQGLADAPALEILRVYALKTAPAFEVALYAGMRLAGEVTFEPALRSFCRRLGVAYQARNDLKDWQEEPHDKVVTGQDALAARPTIIHAFAMERLSPAQREEMARWRSPSAPQSAALAAIKALYSESGAFERTARLIAKERDRARQDLAKAPAEEVRRLLDFVLDVML
ncbi:MAG TPA: polyprenyl synthetase family protein [Candidatus Brocadiia bacterium]|nr:polyprenyl synthetase family protein [Candidatus Brocadiia bacterium]